MQPEARELRRVDVLHELVGRDAAVQRLPRPRRGRTGESNLGPAMFVAHEMSIRSADLRGRAAPQWRCSKSGNTGHGRRDTGYALVL